ncbi:NfeD family protein [Carnobacterium gallinarum]|uniref:NfeD family protein n=1 Tax=Carnobacterium gallinarum TaxID=2749 RepID=UPI0005501030|nr:NfeD family protein [Carnobacterium gallinarum]
MIWGITYETLYFYVLIVTAILAVVTFFIGDIIDFDGPIDPVLIIPFFAFTSLFGYLGETLIGLGSGWILIGSLILASILIFLLNFYLIVPMRDAETTLSTSEKDMEGRVGIVTTPIPVKGMGEISLKSVTGSSTRPASLYKPEDHSIKTGEKVLVIEIRERVAYVVPYQEVF